MSESNRTSWIYVPEVTLGVTPANSINWKRLRYTGGTFMPKYGTQQSEEIRDDRERGDVIQVSGSAEGDLNFEMSAVNIDAFLEAVLGGTWTADDDTHVLKVGTVKRSFSMQERFADLASGNQYEIVTGVRPGQLKLDMAYGQIAKGSVSLMATGWTDSATSAVGSGSVADADLSPVVNSTTDVIEVMIDGAPSGMYFESIGLTLGANLRAKSSLGRLFPYDIGYGSALIELAAVAYFDSRALENKVRSGAPLSMSFTISDGANSYEILLPRGFSTGREGLAAARMDDDIKPNVTITGARDDTAGSSIVITRTLA